MTYWMFDTRGRGDAGAMSVALQPIYDESGKCVEIVENHNARPSVGVSMRVGSLHARSYQFQDWWQTTLVEEIIKDTPKEVVFRTRTGSEYTWRID